MPGLSKRDFLRILPSLLGVLAFPRLSRKLLLSGSTFQNNSSPNIIIFLFDAMSAKNLSVYGYKRHTTPNLERFAETAIVYNAHYSAGNFTTSGTASLLTGLYPWTHRAINYSGLIARDRVHQNVFQALGAGYHSLAFSQNLWPNYFFGQFGRDIETVLPADLFSLIDWSLADKLGRDTATELRAYDDFLFKYNEKLPGSLVFGLTEKFLVRREQVITENKEVEHYPLGLPHSQYADYFVLADVFDGLMATVDKLIPPSFSYFHLWPPHEPFRPTKDFIHQFVDGWAPEEKPRHILSEGNSPRVEKGRRLLYDEYIANVDSEFGHLLDFMDKKGIRDQSYVIVTSDHGEFFERGEVGHATPLLYDPVVRVPLLISAPGQTSRHDVNVPTNSVDLLPTITHLARNQIPGWVEGQPLPLLGGEESTARSIFMMDAKYNPAFAPLSTASFAMRNGNYKLIYYKGYSQYDGKDMFELYDMENDPEELNNLYSESSAVAKSMRDEMLSKVKTVDSQYTHSGK